MPGQHQVEQPRRQHGAPLRLNHALNRDFFCAWVGARFPSFSISELSAPPPLVEQSRHLGFESHVDDAAPSGFHVSVGTLAQAQVEVAFQTRLYRVADHSASVTL
jgi:hypothetical protein